MTRTSLAAILLVLLAVPAGAEDSAQLWHRAYVLEVIEGKVPEAAKMYLGILRSKGVSPEIARESRFRFAVCCVLLGRADEARARLAELAVDETAPAGFKARVEEYRRALEGVGAGTELDKKLEALTFELGRTKISERDPAVYRDFQIIGKPAVPALKRLLTHSDQRLRLHALRILCRMDQPHGDDILPPWDSEIGTATWDDYMARIDRNPSWLPRFEARLLEALPKALLEGRTPWDYVGDAVWENPRLSLDFIRAIAARAGYEVVAGSLVVNRPWTDEVRNLVATWIRGEREELASQGVWVWLRQLLDPPVKDLDPALLDPELFPIVCRYANARDEQSALGLGIFAKQVRPEVVFAALHERLEKGEVVWTSGRRTVAGALRLSMIPVESRAPVELFTKYVDACLERKSPPDGLLMRAHLRRLPRDEGRLLLRRYLAILTSTNWSLPVSRLVCNQTVEDAQILAMVAEEIQEELRSGFLSDPCQGLAFNRSPGPTPEFISALLPVLPRIYGRARAGEWGWLSPLLWVSATRSDPKPVLDAVVRIAGLTSGMTESDRRRALWHLLAFETGTHREQARVARTILGPALIRAREAGCDSASLVALATDLLKRKRGIPEIERAALRFLAGHMGRLIQAGETRILASRPDLFPPMEWMPSLQMTPNCGWSPEQYAAAAIAFLEQPEKLNATAIYGFTGASQDVRRKLFDHVLRHGDAPAIDAVLSLEASRIAGPSSNDALEAALKRLTENDRTPWSNLVGLGRLMALRCPSERLFPLVRRLLAEEQREPSLAGIAIAKSLGSKALVPAIAERLDSMDPGVRTAAREAVDTILEIGRLKDEVKKRIEEK